MDAGNFVWGVSLCWNIGSTVWMYWDKRSDKTADKLRALENQVVQLKVDVEKIQAAAESAPTHNDLAKVYEAVNKTNETVHQLVGENRRQSETLHLIHSFLLNGSKS